MERESLSFLLNHNARFIVVGGFADAESALEILPNLQPDVVLLDIHLPGLSGIEILPVLKASLHSARIMMLTVFEDHESIFDALKAGANGYVLKKSPPTKLLEAIEELHEGGAPMSATIARRVVDCFHVPLKVEQQLGRLSPREDEILAGLAEGFLYKEIADRLGISLGSVRTYVGRIYEKLHVHSRAEAMLKVMPNPHVRSRR